MKELFELLETMSDRIRSLETWKAKHENNTNATNIEGGEEEFDSVGEFQKFIQERKAKIAKESKDLELLRSHMM